MRVESGIARTDGTQTLTGLLAGQTTLTATYQSLTATAQVTVTSGTSLPAGTVRWEVPPAPGFTTTAMVQALPAQGMPAFYSFETGASGQTMIRALSVDGGTLWLTTIAGTDDANNPQSVDHQSGDAFGGVLVNLDQYNNDLGESFSWVAHYDGAT